MEKTYATQPDNAILRQLFRKAELSYAVSDVSKVIGPIVDLMFISIFIGPAGVTVMGYVSPLIALLGLIGSNISSGSRNKVSALLGAGKIEEANSIFSASVVLGGGLSLIASLGVLLFCSGVSSILGANEPQIFEMTKLYIFGYMIGVPFVTLSRVLTPYLQMEGQYRRISAVSMLTTAIDIAADAFVVFVLHGGMFEIALATSLGNIVPFFAGAAFFFQGKSHSVFRFSLKGISPKLCGEIMRLGAPSGIFMGSNAVGGMLINNMLTGFNMRYLVAAYGVFSQITVFVRSSWYAPSDTLLAFSGIFIGEEDRNSLKELQKIALTQALIYTSAVTAFLFAFAAQTAGIFLKSNDPEALRICVECIRVACLSLPFYAIVYNFNYYLMAVKRLRFSNLYSFLIECGNIVPITFIMLQAISYSGAWVSKVMNMVLLSLLAAFYIYRHQEGATYRDKMLLMPDSFGIAPENEIAVAATSADEILDLSRLAVAFALEHGADKNRARTFGLVTEELALVLKEHGFSDGEPHHINARLVAKGEELIIRMRDDCRLFNITEYYQRVREDHEKGVGLSIIMKKSKSVQYTNTLGANNLIVRI